MRTLRSRAWRRVAQAVLPVMAILLIVAAPAAGVYYAYKISGVMQTPGSDVGEVSIISPDGQYVVFVADREFDGAANVYSAPVAGGPAVRISEEAVRATRIRDVKISPDSTRVLYLSDTRTPDKMELYSVPIAGGTVTRLSESMADDRKVTGFEISPDIAGDDFVIYRANPDYLAQYNLYRSRLDSSDVSKVNSDISSSSYVGDDFAIHPLGLGVVYRVSSHPMTSDRHWSLYGRAFSQPEDVNLFTALPSHGNVGDFQFLPNGAGVVFAAEVDPSIDGIWNLYAAPFLVPGAAVPLSDSTIVGQVDDFTFAIDGRVVVYNAQHETPGKYELYAADVTGTGNPLKISGTLCDTCYVDDFQVNPASPRAVYRVFDYALTHNKRDLYSVLLNSTSPIMINSPAMENNRHVSEYAITPNGLAVIYLAQQGSEQYELYGRAINGGAAPQKLSPALAAGTSARSIVPFKNAGALFIAQREGSNADELLVVNFATGLVGQLSRAIQAEGGGVRSYRLSPDSTWLAYSADGEVDEQVELYLVRDMQLVYLPNVQR